MDHTLWGRVTYSSTATVRYIWKDGSGKWGYFRVVILCQAIVLTVVHICAGHRTMLFDMESGKTRRNLKVHRSKGAENPKRPTNQTNQKPKKADEPNKPKTK